MVGVDGVYQLIIMVLTCIVPSCDSKFDDPTIKFHRIPLRNPTLLEKWIVALKLEGEKFQANQCVCSKHFLKSDYAMLPGDDTMWLHAQAVPSVLSGDGHSLRSSKKNQQSSQVNSEMPAVSFGRLPIAIAEVDSSKGRTVKSPTGKNKVVKIAKKGDVTSEATASQSVVQSPASTQNVVQLLQQPAGGQHPQQLIYFIVNNPTDQTSNAPIPQTVIDVSSAGRKKSNQKSQVTVVKSPSKTSEVQVANILISPAKVEVPSSSNSNVQQLIQREKLLKGRVEKVRQQLKTSQQQLRRREKQTLSLWKTCQSLYENSEAVSFVKVFNPDLLRNRSKQIVTEIRPVSLAKLGVVTVY